MSHSVDALLELIRQPECSDRALMAMLDLFEREPAALSSLLIQAMEGRALDCDMLRAAAELLPDECAPEVYRLAWERFKTGDSNWLVAEISLQAARSARAMLHDDWEAALRLSGLEELGGLFWHDLPEVMGHRWIQQAGTAPVAVQRVTRNALQASECFLEIEVQSPSYFHWLLCFIVAEITDALLAGP